MSLNVFVWNKFYNRTLKECLHSQNFFILSTNRKGRFIFVKKLFYSKYGHGSAHNYAIIRHNDNNVILGNRNILFASIPDLLWQFFDRLLLNHRKMRETDTNCSNGKRKKGKVGRFWVIVAAIIHFWFSCNIVLPCVVNSVFSPKLHCLQTMLFVIPGVEERQFLEWRGS